jgi:hypothetical protein
MAAATDRRAPLTHARQPMTLPLSPSEPGIEETVRPPGSAVPGNPTDPARGAVATVDPAPDDAGGDHPRWRRYLLAGGTYLILSLILWWNVVPHPRSVTTCGCGDAALTLWVIKWPAYALSHGLNPFYSSKLFVPRGINMAPNSLGLGVATAPVTWLFGPVASLNLIDLVSPPLSALAMFWLLRRWVTWDPAAFVGGLFFGFSPFALVSLALAHPNFGMLAPVPLIVGCLDDLFVRHRHRAIPVGIALGLLAVIEFFISVEILSLLSLFAVFVAVAWGVRALLDRSGAVRRSARDALSRAAPGLAMATGVAALLLAYPLWFFFAGPAHLSGRAWPDSPAGTVANAPDSFVHGYVSAPLTGIMHLFGGYQGPALPLFSYLGIGMLVVVIVGAVIWHRDPRVRFFGVLGLVAAVLSLGVGNGYWAPWRLFIHLPVLNNVVPVNITAIVDLCGAIVLAVVIDKVRSSSRSRLGSAGSALAGVAAAAVALVPIAVALWPNIPMTVRSVVVPRWFAVAAPRLAGQAVVLPYPAALGGIQSSMAWQAVEGMTFSMVGGGGPGITPSRAGPEAPGFDVLARASLPLSPPPMPTAANLRAIRLALAGWGVTTVVVPDQPGLATYNRGRNVPYAVGLFTAALGEQPTRQAKAWVWNLAGELAPPVTISSDSFVACTDSAGTASTGSSVAACVLRHR